MAVRGADARAGGLRCAAYARAPSDRRANADALQGADDAHAATDTHADGRSADGGATAIQHAAAAGIAHAPQHGRYADPAVPGAVVDSHANGLAGFPRADHARAERAGLPAGLKNCA